MAVCPKAANEKRKQKTIACHCAYKGTITSSIVMYLHTGTQRYCVRSLALLPALDMPVTIAIYLASPACHRQYLCLMRRHRLVPARASSPTTHACPYSGWQLHIPGGLTFEIKAVDKIEGVLREKKAVNNTKPSSRWNCSQDNLRYSITIHMSSGSLKATLYWFIRKSLSLFFSPSTSNGLLPGQNTWIS